MSGLIRALAVVVLTEVIATPLNPVGLAATELGGLRENINNVAHDAPHCKMIFNSSARRLPRLTER